MLLLLLPVHLYLVSIFIEFLMRTRHITSAMAKKQAMKFYTLTHTPK